MAKRRVLRFFVVVFAILAGVAVLGVIGGTVALMRGPSNRPQA